MSISFNGGNYVNKNLLVGNQQNQNTNSIAATSSEAILNGTTTRSVSADEVLNYMAASAMNNNPTAKTLGSNLDPNSAEFNKLREELKIVLEKIKELEPKMEEILQKIDGNVDEKKSGNLLKEFLAIRKDYEKNYHDATVINAKLNGELAIDITTSYNEEVYKDYGSSSQTRGDSNDIVYPYSEWPQSLLNLFQTLIGQGYTLNRLSNENTDESMTAAKIRLQITKNGCIFIKDLEMLGSHIVITDKCYDKSTGRFMYENTAVYRSQDFKNNSTSAIKMLEINSSAHSGVVGTGSGRSERQDTYTLRDENGDVKQEFILDRKEWFGDVITTLSGKNNDNERADLFTINISGVGEVRYCSSRTTDREDGDGVSNWVTTEYFDAKGNKVAAVTVTRSNETGLITAERFESYDKNGNLRADTVKKYKYNEDGSYTATVRESGRGDGVGYYNYEKMSDATNPANLTNPDYYKGEYVESYDANGVLKTITYGNDREGAKLVCSYDEDGNLIGKEFSWKPLKNEAPNIINTIGTTRANNNNLFIATELQNKSKVVDHLTTAFIFESPYTSITQVFNERGQMTEQRTKGIDGSQTFTRNTYNTRGQLTKEITLSLKDNIETRTETLYQYNTRGQLQRTVTNIVEKDTGTRSNKKEVKITTDYIYLATGNIQKRITTETVDSKGQTKKEVEVVYIKDTTVPKDIKLKLQI